MYVLGYKDNQFLTNTSIYTLILSLFYYFSCPIKTNLHLLMPYLFTIIFPFMHIIILLKTAKCLFSILFDQVQQILTFDSSN